MLLLIVDVEDHPLPEIPCHLWNLQTLLLNDMDKDYVLEIWKMPLLRLVITSGVVSLCLPNPPLYEEVIVLEDLHTLSVVRNLKLSEEVLKRIPNVRKLHLYYQEEEEDEEKKKGDYYCLNNLHRLNKLRVLYLGIRHGWDPASVQELCFPYSLKELTLEGTELPWEEMASKIGCLPILQLLILKEHAFIGSKWETVEGQFSSLKFLEIEKCRDLECWVTDSTHFPLLEHLRLSGLQELKEIPSSIGDIPTLRSIELEDCSDSAVESARRIQEEQEEYDNQLLQIHFN